MRVLYVTAHVPHAQAYGAQQRVLGIARLLARFGKVSLVLAVPESWNIDPEAIEKTRQEFDVLAVFRMRYLRRVGIVHRLRHDLDATYRHVYDFVAAPADTRIVMRLMREHNLTWIHTDQLATSLGISISEDTVLDADDLPSRRYASSIALDNSWGRKLLDKRMEWLWHRREKRFVERFSVVCVCSEEDRSYLGSSPRIFALPNGYHPVETVPSLRVRPLKRFGFLGNLEHEPNADGLEWFIGFVWPLLAAELPDIQLRLVGAGTERLSEPSRGITGLGWIPDVEDEMGTWSAMIVPVRRGSGTRVKIAEAFARGCPVISTRYGAFGYAVQHEKQLLFANNAQEFAVACARIASDPALRERLSEAAGRYFLRSLSWDSLSGVMESIVERALGAKTENTGGVCRS